MMSVNMGSEPVKERPRLPEVPYERSMFDRNAQLYNGPLRAMAAGLGMISLGLPQGGGLAATLAIYSNEAARAADRAGEPPVDQDGASVVSSPGPGDRRPAGLVWLDLCHKHMWAHRKGDEVRRLKILALIELLEEEYPTEIAVEQDLWRSK